MEPSTEQHSFFDPPVWTPYPRKTKPNPPRKHPRTAEEDQPEPEPEPESEPEDQPETEAGKESHDDHSDHRSRRGGHTKRYNAILTNYHLPTAPKTPYSLRTKHQAAMTAVLYRSLLQGDYRRASRAFGLLIRCTEVDIRKIWEIGVEILLRRPEPVGDNLGKALEFLHRLVLLYPYNRVNHAQNPALGTSTKSQKHGAHRTRPPKPSVLEFYPALFGLLIKAGSESKPIPEARPESIREQLETLVMTPPWSNMAVLWLLRGMVCNWIADLNGASDMRKEAIECFEKVREMGGEVPEGVEYEEGSDDGYES